MKHVRAKHVFQGEVEGKQVADYLNRMDSVRKAKTQLRVIIAQYPELTDDLAFYMMGGVISKMRSDIRNFKKKMRTEQRDNQEHLLFLQGLLKEAIARKANRTGLR